MGRHTKTPRNGNARAALMTGARRRLQATMDVRSASHEISWELSVGISQSPVGVTMSARGIPRATAKTQGNAHHRVGSKPPEMVVNDLI